MSDGKLSYDESLLEPVRDIFSRSVLRHGAKPKAVAWRNQRRQFRRFHIFSGLFALVSPEAGFSINDLGCGYGAMFAAYQNLPEFANGRYFGYDISAEMLREAKNSTNDPRAAWIQSHIATEEADFSFVTGTYNLNMDADEELWLSYIESNLSQLWSKTRIALGLNMLSAQSTKRYKTLYYADPEHFLNFCSTNMDGTVRMVDRLAPAEFVIFVVR